MPTETLRLQLQLLKQPSLWRDGAHTQWYERLGLELLLSTLGDREHDLHICPAATAFFVSSEKTANVEQRGVMHKRNVEIPSTGPSDSLVHARENRKGSVQLEIF